MDVAVVKGASVRYEHYADRMRKIADLANTIAVLTWDQEVNLPAKGAGQRSGQVATLSGMAHEMFTDKDFGKLLDDLSRDESLDFRARRNIEETLLEYNKSRKYSTEFVMRLARAKSAAYNAWVRARAENDFSLFRENLEEVISLKREECGFLGYEEHPYDAMLDQHEPYLRTSDVETIFGEMKRRLVPFVQEILGRPRAEDRFLLRKYDKGKQWNFGIFLLQQMGYDFGAGRQDLSPHPFTTSFGPEDVRVTTRIDEQNFMVMTWSTIHEGGHALYEQGLPSGDYGLPSGAPLSLGIHESQSRLWENHVGKSLAYWKANYPKLQEAFPESLSDVKLEQFYKGINKVEPSFIRVAADELTYHLHILIRFELEKALIEGSLAVADLPGAWNRKYKEYLGVDVKKDANGVLQDVHWSHGSIGYFPTYSLGSFYAAQFFAKAVSEVPSILPGMESGNLQPLLGWLREKIHRHGKLYKATELCEKVTGEKLRFDHFMKYVEEKYRAIYKTGDRG